MNHQSFKSTLLRSFGINYEITREIDTVKHQLTEKTEKHEINYNESMYC